MTVAIERSALLEMRATWRRNGQQVVLTNGVFDLLHAGHVTYLTAARRLGDCLLVGLNSDVSTRAIKGPQRPLTPQADRATVLAALRAVDYVTIFDEPTAEALVAAVQPDIYVKGGDYTGAAAAFDPQRLPEGRIVEAYGGQVVLLPYSAGLSTTALIERIVERYQRQ